MKGQLITFSGIDGSGKTTQINLLYNYLVRLGKDPIILKQPTDWYLQHPTVRMRIDNNDQNTDLHFLALFSAADRCYQQSIDIAPRLSEGLTVIMDRYVYSAYAYFSARGLHDHCWLETINKFSLEPDLALYLDIDPVLALDRIQKRDGMSRKAEEQDLSTMLKVRDYFNSSVSIYNLKKISSELDPISIHIKVVEYYESILGENVD